MPTTDQGIRWRHHWAKQIMWKLMAEQNSTGARSPVSGVLLPHCASARANYMLMVIMPELVEECAEGHDRGLCELASRPFFGRVGFAECHPHT